MQSCWILVAWERILFHVWWCLMCLLSLDEVLFLLSSLITNTTALVASTTACLTSFLLLHQPLFIFCLAFPLFFFFFFFFAGIFWHHVILLACLILFIPDVCGGQHINIRVSYGRGFATYLHRTALVTLLHIYTLRLHRIYIIYRYCCIFTYSTAYLSMQLDLIIYFWKIKFLHTYLISLLQVMPWCWRSCCEWRGQSHIRWWRHNYVTRRLGMRNDGSRWFNVERMEHIFAAWWSHRWRCVVDCILLCQALHLFLSNYINQWNNKIHAIDLKISTY